MKVERRAPTLMSLLPNGKVLVTGGIGRTSPALSLQLENTRWPTSVTVEGSDPQR